MTVLNTNVSSLLAQSNLRTNTNLVQSSLEKLSSGYRINHSSDDVAGLALSEKLKLQIKGSSQAIQNGQDGLNILQIAEGGLSVITENLQRVRELAIQAANDTNNSTQRAAMVTEIKARLNDNDRIAQSTSFNGTVLLDGTSGTSRIQIGPNTTTSINTIDLTSAFADARSAALGIVSGSALYASISAIALATSSDAQTFLSNVDTAITAVTSRLATVGSLAGRLDGAIDNLSRSVENLTSSNSRIRDLDIASESSKLTQAQVLQQAATSVLSQANQLPGLALSLLK